MSGPIRVPARAAAAYWATAGAFRPLPAAGVGLRSVGATVAFGVGAGVAFGVPEAPPILLRGIVFSAPVPVGTETQM